MSNEIAKALDLQPIEENKQSKVDSNLSNDYEFARGNLYARKLMRFAALSVALT